MRALEVLGVEQPLESALPAFGSKHARADVVADAVVDGVAEHRCDEEHQHRDPHVEAPGRRDRAGGKEQRVARQERHDDEAGFREDDGEEGAVNELSVLGDERGEVLVDVEEEIYEFAHPVMSECTASGWRDTNQAALRTGVSHARRAWLECESYALRECDAVLSSLAC